MSQLTGFWHVYGTVLLMLAWVGALIFPIAYAMTMRFWESELGMHFFCYGVVVWLNLTPQVLFVLLGDYAGRGMVVMLSFHLMTFVIWWRAIVFLKIFRRTHNGKGDSLTPHHTQE